MVKNCLVFVFYGLSLKFWIRENQASSINIAYGKPTHQFPGTYCESRLVSPEAPGGGRYCYNSSLAVDGDINTCSRTTDNGTRPYGLLIVDLEQPYTLHSIKIYRHMSDDFRKQLYGFTVYGLPPGGTRQKIVHDTKPRARFQNNILVPLRLRKLTFSRLSIYFRGYQNGNKVTVSELKLCEVKIFTDNNTQTTIKTDWFTNEAMRSIPTTSPRKTTMQPALVTAPYSSSFSPLAGGLIATGLALVALLIAILVFVLRRCKSRKENEKSGYETNPPRDSETSPYTTISSCNNSAQGDPYETTLSRTDCSPYDRLEKGVQFMQDDGPYDTQFEETTKSNHPHYCTLGENVDPPTRIDNSRRCSLCAAANGDTVYDTIEKISDSCYNEFPVHKTN